MKPLFAFLFFCFFASSLHAQDAARMTKDWERAKAYTAEYLAAMPEDGTNYKPVADVRSFAEQMLHIAGANFMFASQVSGKANPYQGQNLETMDKFKTKAGLAALVNESYDYVLNTIKGLSAAQMTENMKLFNMDMSKAVALDKLFEHGAHHRGQTTIYLRMKGVKPPQEKLF
jgi:uncharacterized damage-inducible protein DinB